MDPPDRGDGKTLVEHIIAALPGAVGLFSSDEFRIRFINREYQNLLPRAYRTMDLTGVRFSDIASEGETDPAIEIFRRVSERREREVSRETKITNKDGDSFWVEWTCIPIDNGTERADVLLQMENISERKRAEGALLESEEKFRHLFENSLELIMVFDLLTDEQGVIIDGILRDANPAALEALGMPIATVSGRRATEIFGLENINEYIRIGRGVMTTGEEERVEMHLPWNGRDYVSTFFPIAKNKLAAVSIDMTEVKRAERELQRSNADLQQFAYVASHDLQEPLRMVSSYLGLLESRSREGLDDSSKEYLDFAMDGAKSMQGMIDDLLSYSRVDTRGKGFTTVDMNQVLSCALKNLRTSIEKSGTSVTSSELPMVTADRSQIALVLQNLLSNAIKYRGKETPRIHVAAQGKGKEWVFSVQDNGIGIDPKYKDRLFKMFQRLHTRDEYEGTGMGLAIARRIVERHGGRIWVESEPGRGSTFYFTIPAT